MSARSRIDMADNVGLELRESLVRWIPAALLMNNPISPAIHLYSIVNKTVFPRKITRKPVPKQLHRLRSHFRHARKQAKKPAKKKIKKNPKFLLSFIFQPRGAQNRARLGACQQ